MRGRPSSIDDDKVLLQAQRVFWEKGYTATSLEDLLKATNLGSGSFYNKFKNGKKELFRKALQQRRQAFLEFKMKLDHAASPVKEIKDFFRSLADADLDTHLRGCILANAVTEMTFLDKELEMEATEILKEVEEMFTNAIRKEQLAGTLVNRSSPVLLGRYLLTVWNGLNVTRRIHTNKKALAALIEIQLTVVS